MEIKWSVDLPYGASDLDVAVPAGYIDGTFVRDTKIKCCIAKCPHWLQLRHRGQLKEDDLFCPEHGISVSTTPTFIFKDHRRNFIVGRELLETVTKVESWRLGNETSEDALSWNVFVGLLKAGGLAECFQLLTGSAASAEPELYVWGNRVALNSAPRLFDRLSDVRNRLEQKSSIPTEPDVILRIPEQAIVLIEAKFGSPNGVFAGKEERFGSVEKYLSRYSAKDSERDPLNREWICKQPASEVLEQLCRNAIFAHWLAAQDEAPFVINLVDAKSEIDVETQFGRHLRPDTVRFARHTWDEICRLPAIQKEAVKPLRDYLSNKTLRLQKAFLMR
jgi:hypothetical protein